MSKSSDTHTVPTRSSAVSIGVKRRVFSPTGFFGSISGFVRPGETWTSCSTGRTPTLQRFAPSSGAIAAPSPRNARGLGSPAAKSFIRRLTRLARRFRTTNMDQPFPTARRSLKCAPVSAHRAAAPRVVVRPCAVQDQGRDRRRLGAGRILAHILDDLRDEGARRPDEAVRTMVEATADVLVAVVLGTVETGDVFQDGRGDAVVLPAREAAAPGIAVQRRLPMAENPRHPRQEPRPALADGSRDVLRLGADLLAMPAPARRVGTPFRPFLKIRRGDLLHPQIGLDGSDRRGLNVPAAGTGRKMIGNSAAGRLVTASGVARPSRRALRAS